MINHTHDSHTMYKDTQALAQLLFQETHKRYNAKWRNTGTAFSNSPFMGSALDRYKMNVFLRRILHAGELLWCSG